LKLWSENLYNTSKQKIKHVQLSVSRMKHNVKITPEQTAYIYIYIYVLTFSSNCFTIYTVLDVFWQSDYIKLGIHFHMYIRNIPVFFVTYIIQRFMSCKILHQNLYSYFVLQVQKKIAAFNSLFLFQYCQKIVF
jgi:hypothetical protein